MKKHECPISAQLVIPASFAECLTYEKQILWLKKQIDNLSGGGDPEAINELRNQITFLETEINSIKETLNEYNIEAIEQSITQLEMNVQLVTNSLANKQDKLTFDEYPEASSKNPVTSGGIHQAIYDEGMRLEQLINNKVSETTFNDTIDSITNNYATNGDLQAAVSELATKQELSGYATTDSLGNYATKTEISDMETKTNAAATYATKSELSGYATTESLSGYATKNDISGLVTDDELRTATSTLATKEELASKQNELTFDSTPTEGSSNPVTSAGIYEALQNVNPEGYIEDTVLEDSGNAVRSSGIYQFVKGETQNLATKAELGNYATKNDLSGYATTESLGDYATKSDISDMETKTEATATYATKDELGNYATKTEISDMETKTNAAATYATKSELSGYATTESLGDYATKSEISDMETKTEAAATYATKDELDNYATKTEISDMETKTNATATYATKSELSGYATTESLSGYVTTEQLGTATADLATKEELSGKQNTLEFDTTPTANSTNPVTSDGIKKAIDAVVTTPITVDSNVSQSSENPVSSNGIYNFVLDQMGDLVTTEQLATKQDNLTFDQTPTTGSGNPVTSGGIYSYVENKVSDMETKTNASNTYATKAQLEAYATTESVNQAVDGKQDKLTFDQTPTTGSGNPVTSGGIYSYVENKVSDMETKTNASNTYATKAQLEAYATTESVNQAVDGKQDKLTFDQTPTPNSTNPVTSGGVYAALQASGGDWYDAYYTEDNKIYIGNGYTSGKNINITPSILCKDIADDIKLLKFTFTLDAVNSFAISKSITLKSKFFSIFDDVYSIYVDEKGDVYGLDTLNVMLYDSSLVNDSDSVKGNYQFMKYTSDGHSNNAVRILKNSPSTAIGAIITWICVGTKLIIPSA